MNEALDPLEVLACEIELRPQGAPGVDEIARLVLDTKRRDGELILTFEASSAASVEAFAAAERQCCSTLSWEIRSVRDEVELSIRGSPEQTRLLEGLFSKSS
jgi:hypothetical protein